MSIALITGATAGIGEATAHVLAKNGYDLIITGRREDRLEKLSQNLMKEYGVRVLPLCFDVQNRSDVDNAIDSLTDDWKQIDVLINNAGLALGRVPLDQGDPADWDIMIDTNIKGVLYMTHKVVPQMIARRKGHIVNLDSIAGKEMYAGGNVYSMTKHAIDALTKAMRIDFLPHHIRVTSICPGAVETEFSLVRFKGDTKQAEAVYKDYEPLKPEDIAEAILFAISRPSHVTINDMLIMPTAQANTTYMIKKD